jgi:hypothetical protein
MRKNGRCDLIKILSKVKNSKTFSNIIMIPIYDIDLIPIPIRNRSMFINLESFDLRKK